MCVKLHFIAPRARKGNRSGGGGGVVAEYACVCQTGASAAIKRSLPLARRQ